MADSTLYVFRRAYTEELLSAAKSGQSVSSYMDADFALRSGETFRSAARTNGSVPQLQGAAENDVEDAIRLHKFLRLTPLEASDVRLWAYLSHVHFREYMQQRWPISVDPVALAASAEVREKASRLIASRWFTTGRARSLGRHALSRLWWATELSAAPWDHLVDDSLAATPDEYHYTRLLFTNQSLLQELLDRKIGWSRPVLVAMLTALESEGVLQAGRTVWRPFFREANFILGYRKLTALDTAACVDVFTRLARSIAEEVVESPDTLNAPLFDGEDPGDGDPEN